jgi:transcriptional regulator with XRE-family HTH domain
MVATEFLEKLRRRREELRMPYSVLSHRSGVPVPTLQRILGGQASAHFDKVLAVAQALEVNLTDSAPAVLEVQKRQARWKARQLVGLVQGTSALEGQAVDSEAFEEMVERTACELLPTKRNLWSL